MFFVYVLQSEVDSSTYVGFSSNIEERLKAHNSGKTKSTKSKRPWKVVYYEAYQTERLALNREKELKTNRFAKEQLFKRIFGPFV